MGEKGKGISNNALEKIAGVGLVIASLGSMYSMTKNSAIDDKLTPLENKIPATQIAEIKALKQGMIKGDWFSMAGESVTAASLGYLFGRKSAKKGKGSGPSPS